MIVPTQTPISSTVFIRMAAEWYMVGRLVKPGWGVYRVFDRGHLRGERVVEGPTIEGLVNWATERMFEQMA